MPITYDVDPEASLVRTRCTGDVAFAEVIDHFRELENDGALPAPLNVLLDLTRLDTIPESEQLRTVASRIQHLKGKVRWGACAIVAQRDVIFGMSRMFHVFAEAHFVRSSVFRDLDEAERWLASLRQPPRGG